MLLALHSQVLALRHAVENLKAMHQQHHFGWKT
jgi:hypothetical protein